MRTFKPLLVVFSLFILSNVNGQTSFLPNVDSEGWYSLTTTESIDSFKAIGTDSIELFHPRSLDGATDPKTLSQCFFFKQDLDNWVPELADIEYGTASIPTAMGIFSNKTDGSSTRYDWANCGGMIFKLPSCADFEMVTSATGSQVWGVWTSTDFGTSWIDGYVPLDPVNTFSGKGTFLFNVKDSASISSATPIWVKVVHGGTGNHYVHKIKINTVDNATYNRAASLSDIQIINFDGYLNFSGEVRQVKLISLTGAVVLEDINVNQINTRNYAKGLYIVKALDREGKVKIQKVVF